MTVFFCRYLRNCFFATACVFILYELRVQKDTLGLPIAERKPLQNILDLRCRIYQEKNDTGCQTTLAFGRLIPTSSSGRHIAVPVKLTEARIIPNRSNVTTQYTEQETLSFVVGQSLQSPGTIARQPNIYLCFRRMGRLGNQMFEFASMLGIARRTGLIPSIPSHSKLIKMFNVPFVRINRKTYSDFKIIRMPLACTYEPIKANISTNTTLYGNMQSWKYFKNGEKELRSYFKVRPDIIANATSGLGTAIIKQHGRAPLEGVVFVGVHIRRGDMLSPWAVNNGYKVGTAEYVQGAMQLFLRKYNHVMFVVCSDDMKWSKKVVPAENATFIENQTAVLDMAILSLCNHTIMTVGSFGWWSAWLAGGTTVYQLQQVTPGGNLERFFTLEDYMLPEWIAVDEKGNYSGVDYGNGGK